MVQADHTIMNHWSGVPRWFTLDIVVGLNGYHGLAVGYM